jgi:hypothetical protein
MVQKILAAAGLTEADRASIAGNQCHLMTNCLDEISALMAAVLQMIKAGSMPRLRRAVIRGLRLAEARVSRICPAGCYSAPAEHTRAPHTTLPKGGVCTADLAARDPCSQWTILQMITGRLIAGGQRCMSLLHWTIRPDDGRERMA